MRIDFNHGTTVDDRIELRILSPDSSDVAVVVRSSFDTAQARAKMIREVADLRSAGFKAIIFRVLTTVEALDESSPPPRYT
jgi:uncharacterized lipoprotein YddW (UPF0748 family)